MARMVMWADKTALRQGIDAELESLLAPSLKRNTSVDTDATSLSDDCEWLESAMALAKERGACVPMVPGDADPLDLDLALLDGAETGDDTFLSDADIARELELVLSDDEPMLPAAKVVVAPAHTSAPGRHVFIGASAPRPRRGFPGLCVTVPAGGAGGSTVVCLPASPDLDLDLDLGLDVVPQASSPSIALPHARRLTGAKRTRSSVHAPQHQAGAAAPAVQAARPVKRQRTGACTTVAPPPSPTRRRRSPEAMAALQAEQARVDAHIAAMVAGVDADVNAKRLAVLATVKRNGNYDSYVSNVALPQEAIPLQVSLVGTTDCPGLLTALQQTKSKGVTDLYLLEHPRGIPKWCLFFRTCFHRLAKLRCIPASDPFLRLFAVPGALRAALDAAGSNQGRVEMLAGHLARLVAIARPGEPAFVLPPTFLHGIAQDATLEQCLKLQCPQCGTPQGWRTCRGCYKAKRMRRLAAAKSQGASACAGAGCGAGALHVAHRGMHAAVRVPVLPVGVASG